MKVILLALGFMAVFEGLLPLLATNWWQSSLKIIAAADPRQVRNTAAIVIVAGLAVIWVTMELA